MRCVYAGRQQVGGRNLCRTRATCCGHVLARYPGMALPWCTQARRISCPCLKDNGRLDRSVIVSDE